MSPWLTVSMALGIATTIIGLNLASAWYTGAIFVGSIAAMSFLIVMEKKKASAQKPNKVDHLQLAGTNITVYTDWLKENVRGHDKEIDEIVGSIQEELGLARPGKIIGAYMLVGPPGTGKTFLSQLIGQCLYPNTEFIRINMNQLKHADDVFTLIGPPPGRPGYEVGGMLTRPVLQNPYRVVIFDEIDKCNRDLHHCLYDILDTGQCREKSSGKMVDFSGCVFFGTTNAGADDLRKVFAETKDSNQLAAKSRDVLSEAGGFTKAFLSRWTRLILMDRLEGINVAEVALLQLCAEWKEYGIEVTYVSPEILLEAVERNEEFANYGVRQLHAFIKQRTARAIGQARAAKVTKAHLDITPDGNLVVKTLT